MPELPEVRAHAERLSADFAGAQLTGFRPISFTALKTFSPAPDDAVGTALVGFGTRGKLLRMQFETVNFVIHLMQGGRLRPDEKQSAKPRGGLARWTFEDGRALLLTEAGTEHRAGIWVEPTDGPEAEILSELGPDADSISEAELTAALHERSMRVHGFLRSQSGVAGLGRRCANEVLHRAKLSPFTTTKKLSEGDIAALHRAIGEVVAESLDFERGNDEMVASKDRPGEVHNRTGDDCPVCGDTIREVAYNRYTVNYCATCQTDGKVLADNTTSKFLK
ncbi:MAG: DNA-formamidopyrimidine glycosylase family protein [Acidimicrobiales bacterium]